MLTHSAVATERSDAYIAELVSERLRAFSPALTPQALLGCLKVSAQVQKPDAPRLLLLAGGAASGKSTLAQAMQEGLARQAVTAAIISSDDYLRGDRGMRRSWEKAGHDPE